MKAKLTDFQIKLPYMMTIKDAVHYCRMSHSRIQEYIADGKLKTTRLPGRKKKDGTYHNSRTLLIYTSSILQLLAENDLDVPLVMNS